MKNKLIKYLKIILCTLIIITICSCYEIKAFEDEEDLSVLYESAKNNEIVSKNFMATITNLNGNVYEVPAYEIIPETSLYSDNESFTSTCIVGINGDVFNNDSIIETFKSKTEDDDDGTYVYAKLTVTYDKINKTSTSPAKYLLTKVSGSWQVKSNQIKLSDRRVAYTCQSMFSKATIKNLSSNSFNYKTGYTTYVPDTTGSVVAAQMNVTVIRGSGKWKFNVHNNVVYKVPGLSSLIK